MSPVRPGSQCPKAEPTFIKMRTREEKLEEKPRWSA
jgi:hypothetical protein